MTRNNEKIEAPPRFTSPFHIEIDRVQGGVAVLVSGVRAIRELTDTTALFRIRGGFLRVSGRAIAVTVYENKTVEVIGGVSGIEIKNDKA